MPHKIQKIAVLGLGTLGAQIAIQAAYYGRSVRGYDLDSEIFPKTIQNVKEMMETLEDFQPCRLKIGRRRLPMSS